MRDKPLHLSRGGWRTACIIAGMSGLCLLLLGCEAVQVADAERSDLGAGAVELDAAGQVRRMMGFDLGLEVREWLVHAAPAEVSFALAAWAGDAVIDSEADEHLRRNGFRVFRVPLDELEELEDRLRPTGQLQRGWRGQVTRWDPLLTQRLRPDQRAVVVDGRVRRFDGDEFLLMARSWIVQMEDGPRMLLQLAPSHQDVTAGTYRRMLNRDDGTGRSFVALQMELLIEPNEAIILTSEMPGVSWADAGDAPGGSNGTTPDEADNEADVNDEDSVNTTRNAERDSRARDRTDREQMGPDAEMPMTVGEVLLQIPMDSAGRRTARKVLIFVPHVQDEATPGDDAAARFGDAGRREASRERSPRT